MSLDELRKMFQETLENNPDSREYFNELLNTKGKVMQEFENGQEVEVTTALSKEWDVAEYLCCYNDEHLVDWKGNLTRLRDEWVRPAQLICDKAREVIKEYTKLGKPFKTKPRSVVEIIELCHGSFKIPVIEQKEWLNGIFHDTYYKEDEYSILVNYDSYKCDELNLSTGEVVQCEGDSASICIIHGCCNKKNEGSFVGDICMPCFEMITTGKANHSSSFIGDYHRREINLNRQLKEKDAEIERQSKRKNELLKSLDEYQNLYINATDEALDWKDKYSNLKLSIAELI